MDYSDILIETRNQVGILTLNSPKTVNALSKNIIKEMISALHELSSAGSAKVIIIKANGKHFSSGHNLQEMTGGTSQEYNWIFTQCTELMILIHSISQIVIAQVHGVATAAGCQLVATCDLVVADQTAKFGTPGVRIGLFCTTPMVALSRTIGRKKALEMLLSGRLIDADEALQCGLINHVVPEAELDERTMKLAETIAEASPLTLAIGKKAFYNQIELDESRAYEYAVNAMTLNLLAEDAQEGISAFLEKRKPEWKGK